MAFSPDGRTILTASRDGRARLWEVEEAHALRARVEQDCTRHILYAAQMNLGQNAWREAQAARLLDVLNAQRPAAEGEDLRGFDWHFLWRLCHSERRTWQGHRHNCTCVVFSPDGKRLASSGHDGTAKIQDARTGQVLVTLKGHCYAVAADQALEGFPDLPADGLTWEPSRNDFGERGASASCSLATGG
jgi:WD40 repeat protein